MRFRQETGLSFPKSRRLTDPDYLDFIRQRPCIVCRRYGVHAHHVKSRGAGGSDYLAVPLCPEHHHLCHVLGKETFQARMGVDLKEAVIGCLIDYIRELKHGRAN